MSTHFFYFVRHGQSILNARGIRQTNIGQLSDKGVEQAHITGERLAEEQSANGKMKLIVCSPFDRTKETAAIIKEHLKYKGEIEYSDLLAERRNPSEIIGKSVDDIEVRRIVDTIDHSFHDDVYRYSDEENFTDLKERAKKCLAYLETKKAKRVVVVTHGIFLKMLIAYMVTGDTLTASEYNRLSYLNPSNNAGITVCAYNYPAFGIKAFGPKGKDRWTMIVWDEHIDLKGKNTTI